MCGVTPIHFDIQTSLQAFVRILYVRRILILQLQALILLIVCNFKVLNTAQVVVEVIVLPCLLSIRSGSSRSTLFLHLELDQLFFSVDDLIVNLNAILALISIISFNDLVFYLRMIRLSIPRHTQLILAHELL